VEIVRRKLSIAKLYSIVTICEHAADVFNRRESLPLLWRYWGFTASSHAEAGLSG
jgi:hypothetical protein